MKIPSFLCKSSLALSYIYCIFFSLFISDNIDRFWQHDCVFGLSNKKITASGYFSLRRINQLAVQKFAPGGQVRDHNQVSSLLLAGRMSGHDPLRCVQCNTVLGGITLGKGWWTMWVICVLVWYSQPLTSIFGLVNSSIKKIRSDASILHTLWVHKIMDIQNGWELKGVFRVWGGGRLVASNVCKNHFC